MPVKVYFDWRQNPLLFRRPTVVNTGSVKRRGILFGWFSLSGALWAGPFYVWPERAGPAGDSVAGIGSGGGAGAGAGGLADKKRRGEPRIFDCVYGGLGFVGFSGVFPKSASAAGGERPLSPAGLGSAAADGPPPG